MTRFDLAKEVDIKFYLSAIGIQEYKKNTYRINDHKFLVEPEKNRFNSFSAGVSGSIVDLYSYINNTSIINAVNSILSDFNKKEYKHTSNEIKSNTGKNRGVFKVINTYDSNKPLGNYLKSRNISLDIALNIGCKVVYFENTNTKSRMFGLGLKNTKGNYVVKTNLDSLKTVCIGSSSPSVIYGLKNKVVVFEGLFDALSYLHLSKHERPTLFILNGASNLNSESIDYLRSFSIVHSCLDNDPTGDKYTNLLLSNLPYTIDQRNIYTGFKDLNEYHNSLY